MPIHFLIENKDQDQTLKRWLQKQYPQITFSQWQKWFRTSQIRLDGKRVKGNELLTKGQNLRLPPIILNIPTKELQQDSKTVNYTKEDINEFKGWIIEENEDYLVINKPCGIAVQGGSGIRKHIDGLLRTTYPDPTPKLVHRIDKDTSGLLIVAKTHTYAKLLTEAFKNKSINKTYLAITQGVPKQHKGSIKNHLKKIKKGQMELVEIVEKETDDAKYSETTFKTLATNKSERTALMQLSPLTGRMHQLRVHCQYLGCPILGDPKYNATTAYKKLHLHAHKITLPKTLGGKTVIAPPPLHFTQTAEKFKNPSSKKGVNIVNSVQKGKRYR